MRAIETGLTRLLGIRYPIVQAGMSWISSAAALPAAVANAGGLGVVAAGPMRLPDLERTLAELRSLTAAPFAVNLPLQRKGVEEALDLVTREPVPILIASQGGPRAYLDRMRAVGTLCIHVVASVEHARKAVDQGVDALVVVGAEAGGHPPASQISTAVLTRAIARALPGTPLIASGGFVDGHGLASALSLGAGAAQFGTRFIASAEANVHEEYRRRVVEAGLEETRAVGRGLGVIRALRNEFTDEMERLEQSGAGLEERRAAFLGSSLRDAAALGDVRRGKVEAGQSAGLVDRVLPAAEIVREIVAEYARVLEALPPVVQRRQGSGRGPSGTISA